MANPLQGFVKALSNAKTRIIVVILLVVAILGISIGVIRKTSTASIGGGKTELAGVPRDIRSVPGESVQNDQYLQTLLEANQQAAQQALKKGTTEVATLVATPQSSAGANYNAQMLQSGCNCNCCCNKSGTTENGNDVGGSIAALEAQGQISPVLAEQLKALQAQNLSPQDYAAKIQELVREGKLSPEAARQLIDAYKNAHSGVVDQAVNPDDAVDQLAASGKIAPDTAQTLKQLNHEGLTPEQYASRLNELVKEGKLTPEEAQQLMHSYQQAHGPSAATNAADAAVNKLLAGGAIDPATAEQLKALNQQQLTPAEYAQRLNDLVKAGKLTPEQARTLLNAYNQQHTAQLAKQTADDVANKLLSTGAIDSATANQIKSLNAQNLSPDQYASKLQQLVAEGKLTPAQAQQLSDAYQRQHAAGNLGAGSMGDAIDQLGSSGAVTPDVVTQLKSLSSGQLTPQQYQQEIEKLVAEGKLTPEQARQLLKSYNDQYAAQQAVTPSSNTPVQTSGTSDQQATDNQQVAQAMQAAIENQTKQLIAAWNPPNQNVVGTLVDSLPKDSSTANVASSSTANTATDEGDSADTQTKASNKVADIRSGDIMFAVLNTAVNSDQPGPVMATIVSGKYKGAKLLGGLQVTPDSEAVTLQFTSMTMPTWKNAVTISSYAIDPDTARTALASDVNHHYLTRFGSVFAAAFMQGIGNAVLQSGSTNINNAGTSTSTYQKLDTKDQVLVGLGQAGQAIGTYAQQGMNRKPTVTVNSGTGIGILFVKDAVLPNTSSSNNSM